MKSKTGYALHQVGNEYVLLAHGKDRVADFASMIELNASGAYLWKKIETAGSFEQADLKQWLLEEYEVDEATAERDALAFIEALQKADVIA